MANVKAMMICVDTMDQGLILTPNAKWDGSQEFEFEITGKSDSDYAKEAEKRRSVSGWSEFLNGAPFT